MFAAIRRAFPDIRRVRETAFVAASYFQLSDGPKSRSSLCRVSRSDSQYCTNKPGPAKRKSCSTARRQKGLRPLSQACPSGGKRGKIDSSKIELGVSVASVVFLTAAPSGGNSSCTNLVRSSSIGVTLLAEFYCHNSVDADRAKLCVGRV